eukprot:SM000055S18259  [mRNA]  locus=s55:323164:323493:- [translate_table: standard]
MVKDLSVAEIVVISALCVVPVAMGLLLVFVAVCQRSGDSDVKSWPSDGDDEQELTGDGGGKPTKALRSDQVLPTADFGDDGDLEDGRRGAGTPKKAIPMEAVIPVIGTQ